MSPRPGSDAALVKERVDIVELVRRYVDLKMAGGRWMGPCPFHQETKPSFSVNPGDGDGGFFYCFGCQAAGDSIDFYCRINGLDFRDGLAQLAEEVGVELKGRSGAPSGAGKKAVEAKRRLLAMYKHAAEHFRRNLRSQAGSLCREYLERREMSREIIDRFGLGFSLDGWDNLLKYLRSQGYSEKEAAQAGLLSQNDRGRVYDRFRKRLIFPISDLSNKVIAFGGRVLSSEDEPKYINSSESPIYTKGDHLYGLHQARRAIASNKRALITEGYVDVLALHQFGYENACGVLGTALTANQVKRLGGFTSHVTLIFDGDAAGRKAAMRSAEMFLSRGLDCRVAVLPQGKDVDDILRSQGRDGLDPILDQAPEGLDYCLETVRESFSPGDALKWAKEFIGNLESLEMLSYYPSRIATGLGVSEAELRRTLKGRETPNARRPKARPKEPGSLDARERTERALMDFVIRYPRHMETLAGQGAEMLLCTDWSRRLWAVLLETPEDHLDDVLDQDMREFRVRSLMEAKALEGREEQELESLLAAIRTIRNKSRGQACLSALRSGGKGSAFQDDLEILRALQEIPREE